MVNPALLPEKRNIGKGINMKKFLSMLLSVALIAVSIPVAAYAADSDGIVDKHGAKTYLGPSSAWGAEWNEASFREVTNKKVSFTGNLTIKAGDIKDVEVMGSGSKLTVSGGTMGKIDCDGTAEIKGGTMSGVNASNGLTLTSGTIKGDVETGQKVTVNGKITIYGSVTAQDIEVTSSSGAYISGALKAGNSVSLNNQNAKIKEIDGQNMAELNLKSYKGSLPTISNMLTINVDGSSAVTASGKIKAGKLVIAQKGEFTTNYPLEIDTLTGPGTLSYTAGKLTIHNAITDKPLFSFINPVRSGITAFKADRGVLTGDEPMIYDYELEKKASGDYEDFVLTSTLKEGVTLSNSSLYLEKGKSATIQTTIKPAFSEFADGTKLVWELHGDTSAFTISPNNEKRSCTVTASGNGTGKATLVAYLVDSRGTRLADYKSDYCILTTGSASQSFGGSLSLDTSAVTVGKGNVYYVLAMTDSTSAPSAMSYNSEIAVVGKPSAYNKDGKKGWLYPVTGVSKGQVTIDIGGQKMIVTVAAGCIVVDTSFYTMGPGGKYYIGVKFYGLDRKGLNVHSANSCTTVNYAGKDQKGTDLYLVEAGAEGTGYVIFETSSGQSVQTQVVVASGVVPHGVSGRMVAIT
ncbi:hypothetical protein CAGA_19540 [Caproiciproducens galactitolivorans]|uniref:Carbohydrate-binding domain-containing protein n=2 Tax=Caproiciproducens galactitolivorans TaxID=642589 RepID=A0A4Z0Y7Q0_9FIRM|nr:hypothetical protein CAGA_19540 [Caproiciproducens galactitolivorans]